MTAIRLNETAFRCYTPDRPSKQTQAPRSKGCPSCKSTDINDYYRRRFPGSRSRCSPRWSSPPSCISARKGDPAEGRPHPSPPPKPPRPARRTRPPRRASPRSRRRPCRPRPSPRAPPSRPRPTPRSPRRASSRPPVQIEGARDSLAILAASNPRAAVRRPSGASTSRCSSRRARPRAGRLRREVGDSLSKIAAKFNCPALLIEKANGIQDAAKIRVGQSLVFPDRPAFSVLVSKSRNTLTVLLDGKLFKHYAVGTGAQARTPAGTFKVVDKISEPPWWPGDGTPVVRYGDPKNILGTHWLALEATGDTPRVRGYGIHGTWDESTIGSSRRRVKCMRNADVAEVSCPAARRPGHAVTQHDRLPLRHPLRPIARRSSSTSTAWATSCSSPWAYDAPPGWPSDCSSHVRKDALLFGFATAGERDLCLLQNVSGIGPKTALGAQRHGVRECAPACAERRQTPRQAPGIGKKTAERIAVDSTTRSSLGPSPPTPQSPLREMPRRRARAHHSATSGGRRQAVRLSAVPGPSGTGGDHQTRLSPHEKTRKNPSSPPTPPPASTSINGPTPIK